VCKNSLDASPRKEQVLLSSIVFISVFTNSLPIKVMARFYGSALGLYCVSDELVIDDHLAAKPIIWRGGGPPVDRTNEAEAVSDRYISPSTSLARCGGHGATVTEDSGEAETIRSRGSGVVNAHVRARSDKLWWLRIDEDKPVDKGKMETDRQKKIFDKWHFRLVGALEAPADPSVFDSITHRVLTSLSAGGKRWRACWFTGF
jgi:hypothetical protein